MPLTLNTSHALYSNLKAFVCVDSDNAIKDLCNPGTTFTVDPAVVIGTGTYGKHFRTLNNGFSPSLVTPVSPPSISGANQTVLFVVNNIAGGGGGNPAVIFGGGHGTPFQRTSGGTTGITFGRWNSGSGSVNFTAETANTIANGSHSICFSRTGTTAHAVYLDGASSSSGGGIGNDTNPAYMGPFGGEAGQNSVGADFVYAMIFDKALSLAEYQEIASSLAAGNVVSLLSSGSDVTPPTITGPGGATGSTSSVSVAENTTAVHTFTANETVTWSLNGGADVGFFSINSSTGALSFITAPDYENPLDNGANNTYVVGVRASDTATTPNTTTQTVTVTVTDVSDAAGVFTSEPLARNNGTLAASSALTYVAFSNPANGAHVVTKTGLSTNGSAVFTTSDALLIPGTSYRADWLEATGQQGWGVKAAT